MAWMINSDYIDYYSIIATTSIASIILILFLWYQYSLPTPSPPSPPTIQSLGHAGFIYTYDTLTVMMDPWIYPAFCSSWFPFPRNKQFVLKTLSKTNIDVLYISHTHEDHLDQRLLRSLPNKKDIHVLCADFTSGHLEKKLRQLGFTNLSVLQHQQSIALSPTLTATMVLDVSFKEDSALLLETIDGHRFLNLNDCNTRADEHPKNITVLATQFSGAQWYPDCYPMYKAKGTHAQHVHHILDGLERNLIMKLKATDAKFLIPSAGVHCFLDNALQGNNIRRFNNLDINHTSIFPQWEEFALRMKFQVKCPTVKILRCFMPGDKIEYKKHGKSSDAGAM